MRVAGFAERVAGCEVQDAGYGMLDSGCQMLEAGYQMPDAGSGAKGRKVYDARKKTSAFGFRAVDFGPIPVSGGSLLQSEFRNPKSKIEGRDAGLKGRGHSAKRRA